MSSLEEVKRRTEKNHVKENREASLVEKKERDGMNKVWHLSIPTNPLKANPFLLRHLDIHEYVNVDVRHPLS